MNKRIFLVLLAILIGSLAGIVWGTGSFHQTVRANDFNAVQTITESLKIVPDDGNTNDKFGDAVVVEGHTMVIGALENNEGGIDSGAIYIYEQVNTTPISWTLSLKLVVSDSVPLANFGASIALEGDTLAVGAPNDGGEIGAVYIFERNLGGDNQWGQLTKLTPENGDAGDYFGVSVALQDDLLFVGADGDDDQAGDAGIVYLFERNQGGLNNWGFVKQIYSVETDHGDHFGTTLAVDGDTLVVGSPFDDLVGANRAGTLCVFQRDEGGTDNWGEVRIVHASDPATDDYFGTSVAISGDYISAGAIGQDDIGNNSGATYVFFRNEGGLDHWGEVKKILASNGGGEQKFGASVAMLGQLLLVGEPEDGTFQTGNGSAYLYSAVQGGIGNYGEITQLLASDGANLDGFGGTVFLSPNAVLIGARLDDEHGDNSGSLYIFSLPESAAVIFLPIAIR